MIEGLFAPWARERGYPMISVEVDGNLLPPSLVSKLDIFMVNVLRFRGRGDSGRLVEAARPRSGRARSRPRGGASGGRVGGQGKGGGMKDARNNQGPGTALVTGASGGIGAEFARALSREGWRLVLAGRNAERLESVRAGLQGPRAKEAIALQADLSEPGAGERLHRACREGGLEVDLLVNNAGSGLLGQSADLPPAALEAMAALNVTALTVLSSLFGRDMRDRGSGRILNVGSFAGLNATPYFAAYAATKSYVLSFSLALRAELKPRGSA